MTTQDASMVASSDEFGAQRHPSFPSSSALPRLAPWWGAVLEGVAGAVMVIVSLGAMAGELGSYSLWVWIVTAVVGGLQCIIIASLVRRFHFRAGGTPQFAFGTISGGSRSLGALSAWCYWFAWTPAIAVNLILASIYIQRMMWPNVNVVVLALCLGATLYVLTSLGLRPTVAVNALLSLIAILVVLAIIATPFIRPSHFTPGNIFPTRLGQDLHPSAFGLLLQCLKWGFVATWTSYAPELASSLCSEVKDPVRNTVRIMWWSASICVAAFCLLPIALFGLFGSSGLQEDPFIVFSAAGTVLLGKGGQAILGIGLIIVLIFGAEAFIIGSSRTIYQMARDGYLPKVFSRVNKRGAPIGSIAWDALVISIMLLTFGTGVVNQVAAANYGYLIVFLLLPLTYFAVRRREHAPRTNAVKPVAMTLLAILLFSFNGILLLAGGAQWGWKVLLVGWTGSLLILPISFLTRHGFGTNAVKGPGGSAR